MVWKLSLIILAVALLSGCASNRGVERINDKQIASLTQEKKWVQVVNFWATWCEPCVEEIPILIRLQKNYKGVEVIGISMDEVEKEAEVQGFVAKHKIPYRIVLRNGQDFETMVNSIDPTWIGALPATFVFKDGKRVYSKVGLLNEEELLRVIRSLLETTG
jgi:thiol-disulfide isomerase/thioredoxin